MKDRIQYGYDRAGNRTWRKNLVAPEDQDQHYLYDPLYQVTAAARGNLNLNQTAIGGIPARRQTFAYDPTGNWERYTTAEDGVEVLDQTRIHNQANQITQIDGSNTGLLYDRAGNATRMPPDASGDWGKHYKLTWDAWNRLVKVEDDEDTEVAAYAYDGTTRRTTKTVDGVTAHSYYNDRWKPVEERLDSATDPHLQYLWGARPGHRDELVRRDRDADDSGTLEEKLYCLMDYFDPTSVVDTAGDVQERYQFSAFGLRQITDADWEPQSASGFDFEFAFHGQLLDPETGYYDYGYRYYGAEVGRWLSRDPIAEKGGINVYDYSSNTPIIHTDFLGLQSIGEQTCDPCNREERSKRLTGSRICDCLKFSYSVFRGGGILHQDTQYILDNTNNYLPQDSGGSVSAFISAAWKKPRKCECVRIRFYETHEDGLEVRTTIDGRELRGDKGRWPRVLGSNYGLSTDPVLGRSYMAPDAQQLNNSIAGTLVVEVWARMTTRCHQRTFIVTPDRDLAPWPKLGAWKRLF